MGIDTIFGRNKYNFCIHEGVLDKMKRNGKRNSIRIMIVALVGMLCIPVLSAKAETTGFDVSAPSAILMNEDNGEVLYEKNAHEPRSAASITKVMTLCLVFDAIDEGRLALEDMLSASAHAASMGGSDIWLKEGEMMSVDDLIKSTVIMSANDAAVVLAESVSGSEDTFVAAMNEKAQALGMTNSVFKNCNGLDEEGHVTTAYDVALMSRELMRHPKIMDYTLTWIDYIRNGETQLVNTNKLIKTYQGITGLKTGTTSKAGSCITATAKRENLSLIAVVLGASSTQNRFQDAAAMLDYGFANWSVVIPENPVVGEIPIQGGMKKTLKTVTQDPPSILMKTSEKSAVESKIVLTENLEAPIQEGDIVGYVRYVSGEKELAQSEIKAAESVESIGIKSSFFYLLYHFFRV
ncbi:D-alanyl-D-alanine carboxypeptidase family protein [Scatolibacter rhodanostii]|uniref:D-alanyl-D-alanine carboxypeptidase family protein n=1 Tax=Scatolibacter rhodanostii TaxID=2014781 RepID=UPI001FA8BF52|nr:D-alanyl-D-alanine carboxypeptidase family protein [Scatolibacter rhodanostii]